MVYTYNITDFLNDEVNMTNLTESIYEHNLPIKHIVVSNIECHIDMILELTSEQQTTLDGIVAIHDGNDIEEEEIQFFRIREEEHKAETGGNFQSLVIDIDITEQGTSYVDKVFPFNISLFSSEWLVGEQHIGDIAEFHLAPDTPIGVIVAPVVTGQTIFNVNDTVIDNLKLGFFVKIGSDDLGMCIAKDTVNMTITTEKPTTQPHNPMEYVLMTVKIVPKWRFTAPGFCSVGESKIGASFIPANTILRMVYHNKNGVDEKLFGISIDYLY